MTTSHTLRILSLGLLLASAAVPALAQDVAVDEAARAALPEAVRESGKLSVATSLQWAPFAYRGDDGEPTGIDVHLMGIIAAKLGLELAMDDVKFPAIVTGVNSGRYQAGVNQLSITPERLEAVAMIPYFESGSFLLVPAGKVVEDVNNLCGMEFVSTQGSVQTIQLEELSAKCVAEGKEPITQLLYPTSAETLLALSNGRGEAFLTAGEQAAYIASVNPKVEAHPGELDLPRELAGIALNKEAPEVRTAVGLALISAIEDGSYQALLDQYGVSTSGVTADAVRDSLK